ncbi:MAG: UDP-N-acetylmuramate dehydrogenase [Actinomycetota bacterium]|jgi:UDP-N-acetylmuramate dehydrogenase|nr:UDP-N-acetylmuramate dehydrogenase [Actinomycetota bacterium]
MSDRAVKEAAAILGERVQRDAPIGPLTTYRVGGPAALLWRAEGDDDLALVAKAVTVTGLPVLVVGKGSNLLVADAGFNGIAVTLGEAYSSVEIEGTLVRAGGAASLPVVARRTAAAALSGFEWAVGVPGSVGGAVRMNAGGHGSDTARTLVRCGLADLEGDGGIEIVAGEAMQFSYRHSRVGPSQVVVWAEHQLAEGKRDAAEATITEIVRWRREHQPGGQNAGSVFTNPEGDSAGRLIDLSGLKGLRLGSAEVSAKHANFIQADDGGSADDVRALIGLVRARVVEATGVDLRPELRMIGFDHR